MAVLTCCTLVSAGHQNRLRIFPSPLMLSVGRLNRIDPPSSRQVDRIESTVFTRTYPFSSVVEDLLASPGRINATGTCSYTSPGTMSYKIGSENHQESRDQFVALSGHSFQLAKASRTHIRFY